MKTIIKTVHEEQYSDGSRTLGVLFNQSIIDGEWNESLIYVYREGMYIFFNTMVEMIDYILYADKRVKRAYLEEDKFDQYYDSDVIDGKFSDVLEWL